MTLSPLRLRRKTENSRHVGVQEDGGFYGDLHKMSDLLIMLLICVESDKIPLLRKLNSYINVYLWVLLMCIAYTSKAVYQDGGLFLVYGIVIT